MRKKEKMRKIWLFEGDFKNRKNFEHLLEHLGVKEKLRNKVDELELHITGGQVLYSLNQKTFSRNPKKLIFWKEIK